MSGLHRNRMTEIAQGLARYEKDHGILPGIADKNTRNCLVDQIISSLRRVEFIRQLNNRPIDAIRLDPKSEHFDPLRASKLLQRQGDLDEAVWMVFLGTHFGKHETDGWKLAANVFGSFGAGPNWSYRNYSNSSEAFDEMLVTNRNLLENKNKSGRFSNHRKYQSKKPQNISKTFRTFYDWQSASGGFRDLLNQIHVENGQEPTAAFDGLYRSMNHIFGFGGGRLGRFDFLTMLGKLELAPIEPGSVYLAGATGPLAGAKLLFCGDRQRKIAIPRLQASVDSLDDYLGVGKQVIEDSICNWQKSPDQYVLFRG